MLFALAGVWIALAGGSPANHIVTVPETLGGKVQPFHKDQLRLAVNECRARIAKDNPTVKITGNPMLATRRRNETVVKLLSVPPTSSRLWHPLSYRRNWRPDGRIMTCKFDIKNKRLVYNRIDGMTYRRTRSPNTK